MKYRKKPVVIEAMKYIGDQNIPEIMHFMGVDALMNRVEVDFKSNTQTKVILIRTLEGEIEARPQDWIIKGIKGEFYPCKPDIFEATYEAVEESK